jgi:hypothetical protein
MRKRSEGGKGRVHQPVNDAVGIITRLRREQRRPACRQAARPQRRPDCGRKRAARMVGPVTVNAGHGCGSPGPIIDCDSVPPRNRRLAHSGWR